MEKPATVYGRTKLRGENVVLRNDRPAPSLRTAWLYSGPESKDFVGTMRRLEAQRDTISVVDDQTSSPRTPTTWPQDCSNSPAVAGPTPSPGRCCTPPTPAAPPGTELAAQVFTEIGADPARVQPCTTADFRTRAPARLFGPVRTIVGGRRAHPLRDWRTALGSAVASQDSPVDHT